MSNDFDALNRSMTGMPGTLGMQMGGVPDQAMFNNMWMSIIQAAQAQMQAQMQAMAAREKSGPMSRSQWQPGNGQLPQNTSCRSMPRIIGDGNRQLPANFAYRGPQGTCGNGNFDMASTLARQLNQACPTMPGPSMPDPRSTGLPYDNLPTVCPPPDEPTSDSTPEKAFIVGDLKKFGGSTVRNGLKELLRGADGVADRKGERTHSAISQEDAAKVRALLESTDPAVRATLAKKVPDGKSFILSEKGAILDTVRTKDIVENTSLNVGAHAQHMKDKVGRNFDRSAGGQVKVGETTYDVAGTELHSPIKIALDGKDAQLNSTNGFAIDLNGFKEKGGQTTTSGGLNANEAWLVRDKDGDGIKKNDVVDGNDVYGDHNGKYTDGYNQLARDFASEIKTDANGKRYIDLTDPNSRAGKELQLLDGQGNLRPAKDVLTRIDVDEMDKAAKNETDGKGNVITGRSNVTYKDGHTATSADQWFSTPKV